MQVFVQRTQEHSIPGYPPWLSRLLFARGVQDAAQAKEFLQPRLEDLHDPLALHDMPKAVSLIRELGARGARAVVYGDYDVDGLCASVIAKEALQACGLKCIIYIPDRHSEGYGINEQAVRQLAGEAELLLTVDCGITAAEEVRIARELGMRVIITDHHQPPEELPQADAVINPLLGGYPFAGLCGAGTAWKLSHALKGEAFAARQLDLAALATIADMVPLLGENRVLTFHGLQRLAHTSRRGLRAMMADLGLEEGEAVSADRISFGIAPRLNAGGRLTTAQDALQLLQTERDEEAHMLSARLNAINAERQQEERRVLQEAQEQLSGQNLLRTRVIVAAGEGWNSGVVGLAAGKLAEQYGYPTVVLTKEGDQLKGSGRSAGGIDLYEALHRCAHLFLRFGGHKQAAGLSLLEKDLPAFRDGFQQAVLEQLAGRPLLREAAYDAHIPLTEATLDAIRLLEQLAPFGIGNPTPSFLVEEAKVLTSRKVGAEGKHLKLSLGQDGASLEAIAFGMGDRQEGLPPTLDAVVRLQENRYLGRVTPQAQVTALRAGSQGFHVDPLLEQRALLQQLHALEPDDMILSTPAGTMPQQVPEEGALLVCRTLETAQRMHEQYPHFHCAAGAHKDARAGSTVYYRGCLQDVEGPYAHILLCDGPVAPQEVGLAQQLFPGATVYAAPESQALAALKALLRPTVDELRDAYKHLRGGGHLLDLDMPPAKAQGMGMILAQIGLISLQGMNAQLLPPQKRHPEESQLYQRLQ